MHPIRTQVSRLALAVIKQAYWDWQKHTPDSYLGLTSEAFFDDRDGMLTFWCELADLNPLTVSTRAREAPRKAGNRGLRKAK